MADAAGPVIRRARPSDLDEVRELYRQLDDWHAAGEPDVVPPHADSPRDPGELLAMMADDATPTWVADVGGQVTGVAQVRVRHLGDLFRFPDVPELENLAVLEGSRGRGIGRALMATVEAWAAAEGYPEIWVSAWSFNEGAAGLYRSRGFRPLSTRYRKPLGHRGPASGAEL